MCLRTSTCVTSGVAQVLRTHKDTLLSVLETLVHDPLVEWVPKNAKSGVEEQENAMARDAMATIEGENELNENERLPGQALAHVKSVSPSHI